MPRGIAKAGQRVSRANERRAIRPSVIDPDQAYDVPETAAALGQSVSATWNDIRDGKLQTFVRGRRRLVLGLHIIERNRADAGVSEFNLAAKLYGEAGR